MKKTTATPKKGVSRKKTTQVIAVEVPAELATGMDVVGIVDRGEYINFLIAASLLNYSKIWKGDKDLEKKIEKIKEKMDRENYMR